MGAAGPSVKAHSQPRIYSQGFLLAEPNRKWEDEEVQEYTSHQSALGHTAGRERTRVVVQGQIEGPLNTQDLLPH